MIQGICSTHKLETSIGIPTKTDDFPTVKLGLSFLLSLHFRKKSVRNVKIDPYTETLSTAFFQILAGIPSSEPYKENSNPIPAGSGEQRN